MAGSIIVKVSELRTRIQDIRRDGVDYVEISISDAEEFDGDILPASISFSGCKMQDDSTWIDYEDVDAVPNNEELLNKSAFGVHMSSNLL